MLKNKRTMWVIFIVLILILLTLVGFYFYKKSKIKDDVLTPEERVDILKDLAPKNTAPIPKAQRTKMLKELVPETKTKTMTSEERLNILNSLSKQ